MKDHNKHNENGRKVPIKEGPVVEEEGREEAAGEVRPAEAVGDMPQAGRADEIPEVVAEELEKLKKRAADLDDKYLRLCADTENFKKRMVRESAEREKYYNEAIIKELLPVMDNLDRALSHIGEAEGDGLAEGVKMVRKQFMDVLAKFGVTQVESVGLPFDPSRQQALMQVETDKYDEGTVVEEFQKGYFLNDRILRPAMVTVSKKPSVKPDAEGE